MVGDAGPDVGVARRAGVPVIGVSFGYTDVPIAELKPDRLIDHMRDLPAAVDSLMTAQASLKPLIELDLFALTSGVNHLLTMTARPCCMHGPTLLWSRGDCGGSPQ